VRRDLSQPDSGPTLVVLEDIHWADDATLDLIKFLARRIHRTQALLILTYRDDELRKHHPLRFVLGDLPARVVTRLHLPPLSEAAVEALVQPTGRSAKELYAATSGNPFFLIESLVSEAPGVPGSVSDAVLAQVVRRSPQAQRLLGVRSLPRGPRPATQANPQGLTPRQLEILLLLAEGLRNPEIADRLSTTPRRSSTMSRRCWPS
jgi:DNA-binding NarL/FixJ family response regulator